MRIFGINNEIIEIRVSRFSDDTRLRLEINDEEDTQILQNYLHKLYIRADTNNITSMPSSKYELLRYGKEQEIKTAINLQIIWVFEYWQHRTSQRSGKMMSSWSTFTLHIRNMVEKARDKMRFVLRVFQSRKRSLMLTLLRPLVIPLLEYCCQLWNPWKAKVIQTTEAIQRTLTYKIINVNNCNCWERQHRPKLYSL